MTLNNWNHKRRIKKFEKKGKTFKYLNYYRYYQESIETMISRSTEDDMIFIAEVFKDWLITHY